MPQHHARLRPVTALAALLPAMGQAAGGHYEVEDADLVDTGACELETWHTRVDSDNHESSAILTCNPLGGFELGAGAERLLEDGDFYDTVVEVNGKMLFASGDAWAAGLYAAGFRSHQAGRIPEWEVRVPFTFEPLEPLALHLNAGWSWQRGDENETLWGVGADYALLDGVSLIVETFGSDRGDSTFAQAGVRFDVAGTEVDLGYGRDRDGDDDQYTLGAIWHF